MSFQSLIFRSSCEQKCYELCFHKSLSLLFELFAASRALLISPQGGTRKKGIHNTRPGGDQMRMMHGTQFASGMSGCKSTLSYRLRDSNVQFILDHNIISLLYIFLT